MSAFEEFLRRVSGDHYVEHLRSVVALTEQDRAAGRALLCQFPDYSCPLADWSGVPGDAGHPTAFSDLLDLSGIRFVTVVEPVQGGPLRPDIADALKRRPARFLPAGLFEYQPSFSLAGPVAGLDHGQLPEHGANVVPVGFGPVFAPPLDVRRLGQIFEQFVRRTYDVVDGRGAVGSVNSEHGEQGEGDHLVGQKSPVKVVDLVVRITHRIVSWVKCAIQAAFGRGVQ